jgi:hypothetical protein
MTKARDLGDFISDGTIAETVTADGLNLGDNEKIQLGASQDLAIYHDGNTSRIDELGTGNLDIRANDFRLMAPDDTVIIYSDPDDNNSIGLYHQGNLKIKTASTGATVTGTIAVSDSFNATSGTFTVQSNGTDILNLTSTVMSPQTDGAISLGSATNGFNNMYLDGSAYVSGNVLVGATSGSSPITLQTRSGEFYQTGMQINSTNSDFSGAVLDVRATSGSINTTNGRFLRFYSDNGTTERFHVTGGGTVYAAGNVGVGTSSPSSFASTTLEISGSSTTSDLKLTNTTTGTGNSAGFDLELNGSDINYVNRTASGNQKFWTNSTERFRIGSSGQLGIGGATYGTAGQVLTSGGSGAAPTWADAGGGGAQFDFTADGAITAGNVVALTGTGKAKVTEASDFAGPTAANTSLNISGDQCLDVGICPRTGRGLIAYVNGSTSIYANGFTQSGGTFTFGSAAFVQNGSAKQENVAVIATGRADGEFAVFYQYSSNNYIQVRIMTVASDRSVTDRDSTTYNVDNQSDQILWTSGCALYGGANQTSPVILCLHDNKYAGDQEYYPALTAIQVNSSSVSVGSTTNGLNAGSGSQARINYPCVVYDSTNTRMIVSWTENSGNQSIRYTTVSGTTLSIGSRVNPDLRDNNNTLREFNLAHSPDADHCVAVFYGGTSQSKVAQAIDNTGSKVGAVLVLEDGTNDTSNRTDREALLYDPDKQQIVLKGVATIHSSAHYAYYVCKVNSSGGLSAVTAVGAPIFIATTDNSYRFNNSKGKMGSVYDTYSNTIYGGIVTDADSDPRVFTVTVGTTFDYLGIADGSASDGGTVTVNLAGSIDENQTGLSAGIVYYTGDNGALAVTGDRKIGKALSSSAILITQAND